MDNILATWTYPCCMDNILNVRIYIPCRDISLNWSPHLECAVVPVSLDKLEEWVEPIPSDIMALQALAKSTAASTKKKMQHQTKFSKLGLKYFPAKWALVKTQLDWVGTQFMDHPLPLTEDAGKMNLAERSFSKVRKGHDIYICT